VIWTAAQRQTVIGGSSSSLPRLRLKPTPSPHMPLDGGWWPRSGDPAAELPGLILALQHHRGGLIGHVMLGWSGWDSRPRRLGVAGQLVRLGWFDTLPAGLLTALYTDGRRVDLLTVPTDTGPDAAVAAMELAAHTANQLHTPDLLIALADPLSAKAALETVWETDGGHLSRQEPAEIGT
jgi:hypothetical protein